MLSRVFSHSRMGLVIVLASAAALLVSLSACGPATTQPTSSSSGGQNARSGLHIRLDADKFEFTSAEQFCQTLATAEVVVGSHGAARWNTADGALPAALTTHSDVVSQNYRIYTPVTFAQFTPLIDHRKVATQEFLTLGGQVGQDSYSMDGAPTLPGTGGDYVIVLYPSSPHTGGNTEASLVVGNAYPVNAQGMVVLQAAGDPNEPGVGPAQPAITITLASLKQQLAGCKP